MYLYGNKIKVINAKGRTILAGESQQRWEFEIVNRLKKDASQFKKRPIKDYLE